MDRELQASAMRPVRMNWTGATAFAISICAILCVVGSVLFLSRADNQDDELAGWLALLLLIASVVGAVAGLILGIVGVATRKGTRGLGLSIASVVLAGGFLMIAIYAWIASAAGYS